MTLTIRIAQPRDLDTIVEYNRRLAWETERYALDLERLRAGVAAVLHDAAEALYLVAEADGAVVGQLMLTREWSDWRNGWFYWIQSVYVSADYRRLGVFRTLYRAAVETVEQRPDAVGLRLYVEDHNRSAQQTYLRLGMRIAGYAVLEHPLRNVLVKSDDSTPAPISDR
jgi:ribosomal protein S18 acetylase RimI-like enzyme